MEEKNERNECFICDFEKRNRITPFVKVVFFKLEFSSVRVQQELHQP